MGTLGKVYLVGAGPGDQKLLTLRGKECLEQADVVLYDYLANPVLLDHVPAHAERIYVGRRGRGRYQDQDEVNRLIIEKAREGKVVVRLKGGDPFVFGRGGEEAEAIAAAGLPFEVHEDPTKEEAAREWPRLATANGTLVFLMGMKNLPAIVEHLVSEGKSQETPVALIRWGTRSGQRTVVGTLRDIVGKAEEAEMDPPTVIVVGDVVRLRKQLNWFETRPLFGKRILVTRAQEQARELSVLLAEQGAEPVECPTIRLVAPESWRELDEAIAQLRRYHWVIFTSVNGVRPFMERLRQRGQDARALAGLRLCCIGPRTAQELSAYGLRADLVPSDYQAEGVIDAMKTAGVAGQRVLIPRAAVAREILPEQLRAMGAEVRVVTAYRTVLPSVEADHLMKDELRRQAIHVITFTSSSTVRNFRRLFDSREEMTKLIGDAAVACIGPITAKTAVEQGVPVTITAAKNTIPALVQAIVQHCSRPASRRS